MTIATTPALPASGTPPIGAPPAISTNTGAPPSVASPLPAGNGAYLITTVNRNGVLLDALGRAQGHGVLSGLALTSGAAQTVTVASGQVMLDGVLTLGRSATVAIAVGAVSTLWFVQRGAALSSNGSGLSPLQVQTGTGALTPPTDASSVYLGAITTDSSGNVTAIDQSGVLYARSLLYRVTHDTGVPSDTPAPNVCVLTRTQSGLWLWDGAAWNTVGAQGLSQTVPLAKLTSGGTNGSLTYTAGVLTDCTLPT